MQNASHGSFTSCSCFLIYTIYLNRSRLDLGSLYIKENRNTEKVWVCLFTCMDTRAVHLEMIANMSTVASQTTELVWKSIIKTEHV